LVSAIIPGIQGNYKKERLWKTKAKKEKIQTERNKIMSIRPVTQAFLQFLMQCNYLVTFSNVGDLGNFPKRRKSKECS
jgi:hypothetical protein